MVSARSIKPFETTKELSDLVWNVYRKYRSNEKIHPATRVFQALRIAVNDELHALEDALVDVKEVIKSEGKILIISFHSLEDRIVKVTFKSWEEQGFGEIMTDKPMVATEWEVEANPRSRSAKMRIFKNKKI